MTAVAFNPQICANAAAMIRQLLRTHVGVIGMTDTGGPPLPVPGPLHCASASRRCCLVEGRDAKLTARRAAARSTTAFTGSGLAALEKRLQQRGIAYRAHRPGTSQMQVFVTDPSGNGVEFNFAGSDA